MPVMIKDEIVAWIWTSGPLAELRPLDRQAIEHATTVLALELLRTTTAADAKWRGSGEILSALLSGRGHGSEALMAQVRRLGHDLSHPHAVIAVRYDPRSEGALPRRLAETFSRMAEPVSPRPLLGSYQGYVVALWPLASTTPTDKVRAVGDEIRRNMAEGEDADRPRAAITGPVTRIADYPAAFATARGAIELTLLRNGPSATLLLTDLGLTGLMLQLPDVSDLSHYVDEVLGPLRAYDGAHEGQLLPTLSALIHNNLSASEAALELEVSKSTVALRRRRIEELLAADFSRVSDLMRVSMALDVEDVVEARRR
jgi:sugar diacid utilization regulator